ALLLTFQHRAGVSPYTSPFGLAETCVFGKQSLGPIHCGLYCYKHPFSRSYGVILPSSLTRVRSLTLEFSSQLPVSVYGTGRILLASSFSWQCESVCFAYYFRLPITTQPSRLPSISPILPCHWYAPYQPRDHLLQLRHYHPHLLPSRAGCSTGCPSPTPVLSTDVPTCHLRTNLPHQTFPARRRGISPLFR